MSKSSEGSHRAFQIVDPCYCTVVADGGCLAAGGADLILSEKSLPLILGSGL